MVQPTWQKKQNIPYRHKKSTLLTGYVQEGDGRCHIWTGFSSLNVCFLAKLPWKFGKCGKLRIFSNASLTSIWVENYLLKESLQALLFLLKLSESLLKIQRTFFRCISTYIKVVKGNTLGVTLLFPYWPSRLCSSLVSPLPCQKLIFLFLNRFYLKSFKFFSF